ncbi:MAG TPA: phosphoenolpyruvate--protein phosphotransferase [Thermoanaerobaculia bacterium]|jgi:phosphotransferase system enzyme I (PtsI)|nr:phosphoenolpyruvate--protein phosphotransferase [Thermoanaerobaculia bacterium]
MQQPEMQILKGLGVSGGIAIGRAVVIETRGPDIFRIHLLPEHLEAEVARLHKGASHAKSELQRTRTKAGETLGSDLAAIFDAHVLLLSDTRFLGRVEERIRSQQVNAEWAVHKTAEELDDLFSQMDDAYLRERSEDLTDVSRHLLRSLQGIAHHDLSEVPEDVVIVADDLTPSDVIRLGREHVIGFAIESGGRTSHTAIIAVSLNLPVVSGLSGVTNLLIDRASIIVDGTTGTLVVHPDAETLERYRRRQAELRSRDQDLLATRDLGSITRDGVEILLMANIDLPEEANEACCFGAAGVGLYRSEFLYIEKSPHLPTEDEHVEVYRRLIEAAAPHPAIIRTYDLGGRKLAREMMATEEENPVLGLRGIRLTLARRDVFRPQIRALYRAAVYGDLWVMLPLISRLEEVRDFRAFAAEVIAELEAEGLPFRRDVRLGVMIEVPAAAVIADLLAKEVDFFSIGTNDLIQYSLAVDRNNEHVAELYQPLHPAILRMLRSVIDHAKAAGIEVGLCGEMAADPRCALLLVGMGLRRLSVSPRRIPEIKTLIRDLSSVELAALAHQCMQLSTAGEVRQHLDSFLDQLDREISLRQQAGTSTVL